MFKDPIRILKIFKETISDGTGLRYSIYFSGCTHRCKDCHNPASWKSSTGTLLTWEWLEQIVDEINDNPLLDGVTYSGGDPLFYPDTFYEISKFIQEKTHKNSWCYTGYTLEEILKNLTLKKCLNYIDVLVDGRFEIEKFSPQLSFVGSSNQRIIALKKELKQI